MLKRGTIEDLLKEYEELERRLGAPDVVADPSRSRELAREYKRLSKVAEKARRWIALKEEIENAREMADEETSPDLKAYLSEEIERILTSFLRL